MKKLFVMMLVVVMSIVMLAGCGSGVEDAGSGESSEVVSEENTEKLEAEVSDVEEIDTEEDESLDVPEEASEAVEETTMYSADEVMAHIDTLIAQFQYDDPENIKCLVIAANLDYISEEELKIILTTYGYTMEELAQMYLGEGGPMYSVTISYSHTKKYYESDGEYISDESERYANRITLESIMLNESDKELAQEIDGYLLAGSVLDRGELEARGYESYEAVTSGEKVIVSQIKFMFGYDREYNPYIDYINANS